MFKSRLKHITSDKAWTIEFYMETQGAAKSEKSCVESGVTVFLLVYVSTVKVLHVR